MTTVRPIRDLDVPLPQLEADIRALTLRQAAARSHSPSDRLAYALDEWLVTHTEAPVSTAADYPEWAAAMAANQTTPKEAP